MYLQFEAHARDSLVSFANRGVIAVMEAGLVFCVLENLHKSLKIEGFGVLTKLAHVEKIEARSSMEGPFTIYLVCPSHKHCVALISRNTTHVVVHEICEMKDVFALETRLLKRLSQAA